MLAQRMFLAMLPALMFAWMVPDALYAASDRVTEGRLNAFDAAGKELGPCPLKHTDVQVDIAGFIGRVTVKQQFHNPFKDKIEAVYVFPLSQDAAVDDMTMTVGDRVVKGEIKERGEARQIYEQAKAAGKVASLLDQERPNIFTQSVANIEPGEAVDIEISYSETLDWRDGEYHFDFPMVVGPRYMPGTPSAGAAPQGFAPPTDQVPDADRISPHVAPEGQRAGHDISVSVKLNAGIPLQRVESAQHDVSVNYTSEDKSTATITLKDKETIPNKDFVLVYQTATDEIEDTLLTHTDERGKFFTLVLQPPKRVRPEIVVPKEIVFVIDKSGSMRGFPLETAKEAMRLCIEGLHENDTFNLMTFAGGVGFCFPEPVKNSDDNRQQALAYLGHLRGGGGTEMMKAIHACLSGQKDPERIRVVCFMTDGYVGNDMAIIDAVKKNAGEARVFSFGIGSSVNRFLLDGMARAGRGEVHYILNQQHSGGSAERFYERVRMPVLTDVEVDFENLVVESDELYPQQIPDLFSAKPVIIQGRYKKGGEGTITLKGQTGEGKFERKIEVTLPDERPQNALLAPLWARAKVDYLMNKDLAAVQRGQTVPAVKEEVLGLGLRYRLLTQFTSFVAVEHLKITEGDTVRTVPVPVEMPAGVSHEGVFGKRRGRVSGMALASKAPSVSLARGQNAAAPSALRKLEKQLPQGKAGGMGGAIPGQAADDRAESGRRANEANEGSGPVGGDASKPRDESKDGNKEEATKVDRPDPALSKLAPELRRLVQKLKAGETLTAADFDGMRHEGEPGENATVEIRVSLSSLDGATIAALKKAGLTVLAQAKSVKLVVGKVKVQQIKQVAAVSGVVLVEPSA